MIPRFLKVAALVLALGPLAVPAARADTEVDLALVIAVDISYSMDLEELALQRQGFADAFHSPIVHDAIRKGNLGKIAVAYVEWAGAYDQRVMVPWTVLEGKDAADALADRIAAVPVRRAQRTSISGAIDFSTKLLAQSGMDATRQVIDVSGDGPNNQGRFVEQSRDETVAKGITINGLPILLRRPGYLDVGDLDLYYRDCVIGGQGAFMVPVREREQFREAVKTKIIMEIAGLAPPPDMPGSRWALAPGEAEIQPAGQVPGPLPDIAAEFRHPAQSGKSNCLVGESQWRDRMGN